ncbi:putative molybdenum carrier protein [Paracoccus niistensis]|uniref:Molybdenum carrier protein n=1 Tax=Paracoccus niistensis TaxID=632935 RepID=A0ABV6I8L1_9RHOB
MVAKIISGGQTGVDRAALDVGLEVGISVGGWVPKGRIAEDGIISDDYPNLVEADDAAFNVRTRLNVGSADATLILTTDVTSEGTDYTRRIAQDTKKPCTVILLVDSDAAIERATEEVRRWLKSNKPTVLNVAGPRESQDQNAYMLAKRVLLSSLCDYPASVLEHGVPDAVLDRALDNIRHWDNIRWIVPFWYLSVAGASFLYLRPSVDQVDARLVAAAVLIVGAACLWLMYRTMHYHNAQREALIKTYFSKHMCPKKTEDLRPRSTDVLLSMTFRRWDVLPRATTWFMVLMAAVCGFAALVLWYGDIPSVIAELARFGLLRPDVGLPH